MCSERYKGVRSEPVVGVVVLAAGSSSRLGREKQLLPWRGRPLLAHVLLESLEARVFPVVAVLGHKAHEIRNAIEPFLKETYTGKLLWVVNADYQRMGMSSSLVAGMRKLPPSASGVVFVLADQPLVRTRHLDNLVRRFGTLENSSRSIFVSRWQGRRGHPVLFGSWFFPELLRLEGDEGARSLIQKYDTCVQELIVDEDTALDIDTWDDYLGLISRMSFCNEDK